MEHISSHMLGRAPLQKGKKTRETERGELMTYFINQLNPGRIKSGLPKISMPRMGRLLEKIPTKDLYYLKTVCDKAPDFSKKFWWEINPKNHTPEAKAKAAKKWEEKKKQRMQDAKRNSYREAYNNL